MEMGDCFLIINPLSGAQKVPMDARTDMAPGRTAPPPRRTPKGRQVDPQALDEVRALLGDRPRRRDLLIEHLHLIQDHYGYISGRASRRARRRR